MSQGAVASRTKQANAWIVPDCDTVLDWLAASSIAVDWQLRSIGRRSCQSYSRSLCTQRCYFNGNWHYHKTRRHHQLV